MLAYNSNEHYYSDPSDPDAFSIVACPSNDGGGDVGGGLSDLPASCETISDRFPLAALPGFRRGYVTDYIGGTGLSASVVLFVDWTQITSAPVACANVGADCRASAHGTGLLACNEEEVSCKRAAETQEDACNAAVEQAQANLARLPPLPPEIAPVAAKTTLSVNPLGPSPTGGAIGASCGSDADCASTPGAACIQASCGCPAPLTLCGLSVGCVDLSSDPDHCGTCNDSCGGGTCNDGACMP